METLTQARMPAALFRHGSPMNALETNRYTQAWRAFGEGVPRPRAIGGGAPVNAPFSLDHLRTLWGKRVIGVLGGGGRSGQLIPALVELWQQGRFPFEKLVRYYERGDIEQALADSRPGEVIKPILRLP